jgi:hypothetical protein
MVILRRWLACLILMLTVSCGAANTALPTTPSPTVTTAPSATGQPVAARPGTSPTTAPLANPTTPARPSTGLATPATPQPATPAAGLIPLYETAWAGTLGLKVSLLNPAARPLTVQVVAFNSGQDTRPFDIEGFRLHNPNAMLLTPTSAKRVLGTGTTDGRIPPRGQMTITLQFATSESDLTLYLTHDDFPGLQFACPLRPLPTPTPTSARPSNTVSLITKTRLCATPGDGKASGGGYGRRGRRGLAGAGGGASRATTVASHARACGDVSQVSAASAM